MNRLKKEQLISLVNSQNDSINKLRESLLDKKEEVLQVAIQKIKELEQENKELKKVNQSLSMLGTDLASANETVRKEFFRADKNKDMWREKAEEYRSALEEIREDMEQDTTCESRECGCDDYAECLNCIKETILNKINEVLK